MKTVIILPYAGYQQVFVVVGLLMLLCLWPLHGNAECNVCQANHAACINRTSYHFCFDDDEPFTDILFHCNPGFDCTSYAAICVQSNPFRPPSCEVISLCGDCSAHRNSLFACQSRSSFQMCYGAPQPLSELGYCPLGYVCDASSDSVCVPARLAESITCDLDEEDVSWDTSTTTTTTPMTTTSKKPTTPDEMCANRKMVGLLFVPTQDGTCRTYWNCVVQRGVLVAELTTCPSGTYFDNVTWNCKVRKPEECK